MRCQELARGLTDALGDRDPRITRNEDVMRIPAGALEHMLQRVVDCDWYWAEESGKLRKRIYVCIIRHAVVQIDESYGPNLSAPFEDPGENYGIRQQVSTCERNVVEGFGCKSIGQIFHNVVTEPPS